MSSTTTMRVEYEDGDPWARRIIVTDERGKGDHRFYTRDDLIPSTPALEVTDEVVRRVVDQMNHVGWPAQNSDVVRRILEYARLASPNPRRDETKIVLRELSLREHLLEAVDKTITIDEDRHGRRRTTVKLIDVGENYLVTWRDGAARVVSIDAVHKISWRSDEPREVVVAGSLR